MVGLNSGQCCCKATVITTVLLLKHIRTQESRKRQRLFPTTVFPVIQVSLITCFNCRLFFLCYVKEITAVRQQYHSYLCALSSQTDYCLSFSLSSFSSFVFSQIPTHSFLESHSVAFLSLLSCFPFT